MTVKIEACSHSDAWFRGVYTVDKEYYGSYPVNPHRVAWVIEYVYPHPKSRKLANEVAKLEDQIDDLVIANVEAGPFGRRVRLKATKLENGQWKIEEYDFRKWSGIIGGLGWLL